MKLSNWNLFIIYENEITVLFDENRNKCYTAIIYTDE